MQLFSRIGSLTLIGLIVCALGLSPPANAAERSRGMTVIMKGQWTCTTYDPGAGAPAKLAEVECASLLPTPKSFASALVDSNGQSVSGYAAANVLDPACGIVMAGVADNDTRSATYMRTDSNLGWCEVEATCYAGHDAYLVRPRAFAKVMAEVKFASDFITVVNAFTEQSYSTDNQALGTYTFACKPQHKHGCGFISSFHWITTAKGMLLVGAEYVQKTNSDGFIAAQLWNCDTSALVLLRD